MPHKSLSSPFSTFYPYSEKNYTPSNTDAIIYDLFRLLVFFFNVFQQRYTGQIGSEGAQAVSLALYARGCAPASGVVGPEHGLKHYRSCRRAAPCRFTRISRVLRPIFILR